METKVTILGQTEAVKPELKKIEFVNAMSRVSNCNIKIEPIDSAQRPDKWGNIQLIEKDYLNGFDLMYAYDTPRNYSVLVLGHFNDGVV